MKNIDIDAACQIVTSNSLDNFLLQSYLKRWRVKLAFKHPFVLPFWAREVVGCVKHHHVVVDILLHDIDYYCYYYYDDEFLPSPHSCYYYY